MAKSQGPQLIFGAVPFSAHSRVRFHAVTTIGHPPRQAVGLYPAQIRRNIFHSTTTGSEVPPAEYRQPKPGTEGTSVDQRLPSRRDREHLT
jgi:hypothetical protein